MAVYNRVKIAWAMSFLLPGLAGAQVIAPDSGARYGFTLGVAVYQMRDEVLNDLRHRGPTVSAGVFREGSSANALHRVGFSFSFAALTDRYSLDRSSLVFHPTLEVRYARRVARVADDLSVFVGATGGWSTRFAFFENWDQGHAYWMTSAHLGFSGALVRTLDGGGRLRLDLDAPVLAAVSRPPDRFTYKEANPDLGWVLRQIHQGMRITSVHEHTALAATITWDREGGGFLRQSFFWRTDFVSSRLPAARPLTILTHSLGISQSF